MEKELEGLPDTRPLAPDTPVISSAQREGGLHNYMLLTVEGVCVMRRG